MPVRLSDGDGQPATAAIRPAERNNAATGAGLTGTSASGTVQAKAASGTDLQAVTAKKHLRVQTLATGIYTLEITDSGKTGFYVCAQNPQTGVTEVSAQLVTGDYGS